MALFQIPNLRLPTQTGVYFDNGSASGYQASLSTYNWTHRVGTGIVNNVIVVGVSIFATGTVSSVTAGALSLTFVRSDTNGVYRSEIWQGVGVATGNVTVTVTLSASLTSIANAQTYWNASVDNNAGGNGTSTPASASITPSTNASRIVGNMATLTASGVTSAGAQAPRTSNTGALGTGASDDKGIIATAASTTLTWNGIGATNSWAVSLLSLKPFTAPASGGFPEWPILQGYGNFWGPVYS